MNKAICMLAFALILVVATGQRADALPYKFSLKSGSGDEVTVNNGWFGRKQRVVKDRYGDRYVRKKGWFSRETDVNLMGNGFKYKHGLFGRSSLQANTIFGDSVKSKKGWLMRTTTVNASGLSGLIGEVLHPGASRAPGTGPVSRPYGSSPTGTSTGVGGPAPVSYSGAPGP